MVISFAPNKNGAEPEGQRHFSPDTSTISKSGSKPGKLFRNISGVNSAT